MHGTMRSSSGLATARRRHGITGMIAEAIETIAAMEIAMTTAIATAAAERRDRQSPMRLRSAASIEPEPLAALGAAAALLRGVAWPVRLTIKVDDR